MAERKKTSTPPTTKPDTARFRIQGAIDASTLARYEALKEREGWTARKSDDTALTALMNRYEQSTLDVTPDAVLRLLGYTEQELTALPPRLQRERLAEQADIIAVLDHASSDFWDILRRGLVYQARKDQTLTTKLAQLDPATLDELDASGLARKNRVPGSSAVRIQACVDQLIQQNLAATTALDLLYITRGIVQSLTRVNSDLVSQWFDDHASELEAHHHACGIGSHKAGVQHNRMRARHHRLQMKKNGTVEGESA